MRTAFSLVGNGSFLLLVITITFIRQPHDYASGAHLEKNSMILIQLTRLFFCFVSWILFEPKILQAISS